MNKLFTCITITLALTACNATVKTNTTSITNIPETSVETPKNIIMVVADGMGPAYTTAYRYFKDDKTTAHIEETVFDRHLLGLSSTYPARESGYITDSAAGATALSAGIKTYNGAIAVDVNKKPVNTVLQWAKKQGKKTGVVVTSQVNHATPAAYITHNESRENYNAIADSYLDNGINTDLILGGGWKYFIREDRNLVSEYIQADFQYIDNYQAISQLAPQKPVLGLFAEVGLPAALDDSNPHRLSMMTKAATSHLANDNGFFLLVEASQVDWAGHGNDIASAMAEMDDLAKTMEYLELYVKNNPDTLVVLTADHSTGGLTVAANGKYIWQPALLHQIKKSPKTLAKQLAKSDLTQNEISTILNFEVSKLEAQQLQQAKYKGFEQREKYRNLSKTAQAKMKEPSVEKFMHKAVKRLIDSRTNTGWTSGGHTGIDVPIYALGKQHDIFSGQLDNTDIAEKLFSLLGKKQ
ncbi:alkaline phosphatase [Litorilituus lipolyticus]|uniref:Alkaline phosphatase n=1 Tax=Litorilituus lipolyticus TaxID=2491017 RepID=A0A502KXV3_9GAMM|nr:alkaline phosphatase [Litorilituus lipolyticus]TPH16488.1 alkaline phosphatase [Litorilituus lipolyticus]